MSESDSDLSRSSNIFSGNFLNRPLVIENLTHFSTLGSMGHNSLNDIVICVSLSILVSQRAFGLQGQFLNVMREIFSDAKALWTFFGTTFLVSLGFGLDRIWEMSQSYTIRTYCCWVGLAAGRLYNGEFGYDTRHLKLPVNCCNECWSGVNAGFHMYLSTGTGPVMDVEDKLQP